ncbi:hypothetical protein OAS39_01445 [Pirellulales bacterium]|nr:hypothetical protein [Pirellulales bacterium]
MNQHQQLDLATVASAHAAYRLMKIGVVALIALTCAVPVALNLVDPDLWGHVRYGQDWLTDGHFHRTATHTYTAVDYPWINHENAAELLFATLYDRIGIYPMVVLKCLLGLGILTTMVWVARRHGVNLLTAWAWMLLIASNLQAFFPMRPQLLSFLLCSVVLVCLDRGFTRWQSHQAIDFRWLWPLPLVFIAWTNSHGAFVAGLCIVGALLAGRMIELFVRRGWNSIGAQVHLAAIGLACLAATLVNPYGIELHSWLLQSLGEARPEITEWAPPTPGKPVFWPLVTLIAAAVVCLAATRQRRDWPQIFVLALVCWQACEHLRHIAFFALLCGFWLPAHVQSAVARLKPGKDRALAIVVPPTWFRVAMGSVLLGAITLQSMALADRLANFPVYRNQYPVDAVQYMVDHRLQGRVVVCFNWAQYAIASLAPHSQVQFDGRFRTCYPRVVADMHFDFLDGGHGGRRNRHPDSGPIDPRRVLEYGDPELILLDRKYRHARDIMEAEAAAENPEWVRLYRDRIAEVWGRTSRFGDPDGADYLPPEDRVEDPSSRSGVFHWPALPDYSLWEEETEAEREAHANGDEAAAQFNPH